MKKAVPSRFDDCGVRKDMSLGRLNGPYGLWTTMISARHRSVYKVSCCFIFLCDIVFLTFIYVVMSIHFQYCIIFRCMTNVTISFSMDCFQVFYHYGFCCYEFSCTCFLVHMYHFPLCIYLMAGSYGMHVFNFFLDKAKLFSQVVLTIYTATSSI